ncbi:MAG TPA: fumarylacetoacetate hydrolase family protein [Thermomicrobiales bacterium]|nr:fumarylacetoacetate hydrolase family protein [Thermomicrobiales bacterium]
MRKVRFAADGRIQTGESIENDTLLVGNHGTTYDPADVVWLPPVEPQKVVGLALNYADHAEELGLASPEEPALFFKPLSSLIGHRAPVVAPANVEYMHYEVELAVVIGRPARRVRAGDAMDCVLGYTIANDITVRDFVHNFYRPPVKAKGFDTFGPMGPYLVIDEIDDPSNVELRAYVNGELRQTGNTSLLIRDIPALIEYITEFMTLEPMDVILTGTPKGISHIYPGDVMRLEVDGLGTLENRVVASDNA